MTSSKYPFSLPALVYAGQLVDALEIGDAAAIESARVALKEELLTAAVEGAAPAAAHARERAVEMYGSDDINIDPQPLLSIGEDGVWVAAWVHVPNPSHDDIDSDEEA